MKSCFYVGDNIMNRTFWLLGVILQRKHLHVGRKTQGVMQRLSCEAWAGECSGLAQISECLEINPLDRMTLGQGTCFLREWSVPGVFLECLGWLHMDHPELNSHSGPCSCISQEDRSDTTEVNTEIKVTATLNQLSGAYSTASWIITYL